MCYIAIFKAKNKEVEVKNKEELKKEMYLAVEACRLAAVAWDEAKTGTGIDEISRLEMTYKAANDEFCRARDAFNQYINDSGIKLGG